MPHCAPCKAGPSGIEGHGDLFTYSMDSRQMQFRCQACGTFWIRRYSGAGAFEWAVRAGDPPGMEIPGRLSA